MTYFLYVTQNLWDAIQQIYIIQKHTENTVYSLTL